MGSQLRVVWASCLRTWIKLFRRPVVLAFSLVQPLVWMLLFGFLFHRYRLEGLPEHVSYLEFLLPGICVMTVLFGASQSGIILIRDMQTGILARQLGTPADPARILLGKLIADIVRLLAQAGIVAMAGWILGASFHPATSALALALLYLALLGVAHSCLSCWLALRTGSQEAMGVFIQVCNMPLLFTSSVLVPIKDMPGWMGPLAAWNPLSIAADMLRGGLLFGRPAGGAEGAVVLGSLAIILYMVAASTLASAGQGFQLRKKVATKRPGGSW